MEVPLAQNKFALIDPEDWPLGAPFKWHAKKEHGGKWYAATSMQNPKTGRQECVKMPRLITGAGPDEMVDHREIAATPDNRRSNMRICSNAENQQNSRSRRGASPFKGVSWYARHGR